MDRTKQMLFIKLGALQARLRLHLEPIGRTDSLDIKRESAKECLRAD